MRIQWVGNIFSLSMIGSIALIIVFFLRLILMKLPKRSTQFIWILAALALLSPIRIESETSIIPEKIVEVYQYPSNMISKINGETQEYVEHQKGMSPTLFLRESVFIESIWLLGMISLICWQFMNYYSFKFKLKHAYQQDKNIYVSNEIGDSFVLGVINSKIYLPANISENDKYYVLKHEEKHIQRKDCLWKMIAIITLCIHWFNPLVWIAFRLFEKDIEYAVDEAVIHEAEKDEKKQYLTTLLNLSICNEPKLQLCLAFDSGNIKHRIKHLTNIMKPAKWTFIVTIMITVMSALVLMVHPVIAISSTEIQSETEIYYEYGLDKIDPEQKETIDTLCTDCKQHLVLKTSYGKWEILEKKCSHPYPYGTDAWAKRIINQTTECEECNEIVHIEEKEEMKFLKCFGWYSN